jgi:hypothetical protein
MMIELKTSMAEMCWPECNICIHFVHGLQMIGSEENHSFIGIASLSYIPTDRLHPPPHPISTQSWAHQNFPEPFGFLFRSPAIIFPFLPPRKARCFFFHPKHCFRTFSSLFDLFLFLSPSSTTMISPQISLLVSNQSPPQKIPKELGCPARELCGFTRWRGAVTAVMGRERRRPDRVDGDGVIGLDFCGIEPTATMVDVSL